MTSRARWRVLKRLDDELSALEDERSALRSDMELLYRDLRLARDRGPETPSFRRLLSGWWRESQGRIHPWVDDPMQLLEHKLDGYRWARSHGIDHPPLFGVWRSVDDIPWDSLPDAVTIKAAFSYASRSVLPIRRVPGGWTTLTEDVVRTSTELAERLRTNESAHKRFRGPYFAEALLAHPSDPHEKALEIKAWTFGGEIGWMLARRSIDHHDIRNTRFRYIDEDGRDLGSLFRTNTPDPTVEQPDDLTPYVTAARTLSEAVRRPCSRVDLFAHEGGVVFGEMTTLPGPRPILLPEWDERAGRLWEAAEQRIRAGFAEGRGLRPEWGAHERTLLRSDDLWLGGIDGFD